MNGAVDYPQPPKDVAVKRVEDIVDEYADLNQRICEMIGRRDSLRNSIEEHNAEIQKRIRSINESSENFTRESLARFVSNEGMAQDDRTVDYTHGLESYQKSRH